MLRPLRARLLGAFLAFLTTPVRRDRSMRPAAVESLAGVLCPGDVLLSEGTTRASMLVKCLTRSSWSHVSMYVGPLDDGQDPRCIVEADIAEGVRSIRLSELDAVKIRVLRPMSLDSMNRSRLAAWVTSRIGSEYDHAHAWMLGRTLLRLPARLSLGASSNTAASTATRFICCSLLAHALASVGLAIAPARASTRSTPGAEAARITPGDFEQAPVFEVIAAETELV